MPPLVLNASVHEDHLLDEEGLVTNGEPAGIGSAGAGTTLASGTSTLGEPWELTAYDTVGDLICIDVISTDTTVGSCFERGVDFVAVGRAMFDDGAETIAYGVLPPALADTLVDRSLDVSFSSGRTVTTEVAPDGVFFATALGLPVSLSGDLGGEPWVAPFG